MAAIEDEENGHHDGNDNDDDDGFNITCTAFGIYPEPEIKLLKIKSINETLESYEIESNTTTIISFRSMTNGFYSITLVSHIEQNQSSTTTRMAQSNNELNPSRARLSLKSQPSSSSATTMNQIAEHYECRLSIPNTDYVEVKRLAIQDGKSYAYTNTCRYCLHHCTYRKKCDERQITVMTKTINLNFTAN